MAVLRITTLQTGERGKGTKDKEKECELKQTGRELETVGTRG
jgi:hypothetical protein